MAICRHPGVYDRPAESSVSEGRPRSESMSGYLMGTLSDSTREE